METRDYGKKERLLSYTLTIKLLGNESHGRGDTIIFVVSETFIATNVFKTIPFGREHENNTQINRNKR